MLADGLININIRTFPCCILEQLYKSKIASEVHVCSIDPSIGVVSLLKLFSLYDVFVLVNFPSLGHIPNTQNLKEKILNLSYCFSEFSLGQVTTKWKHYGQRA